eukprot:10244323-Alexandrium_andersonii.AAC.1
MMPRAAEPSPPTRSLRRGSAGGPCGANACFKTYLGPTYGVYAGSGVVRVGDERWADAWGWRYTCGAAEPCAPAVSGTAPWPRGCKRRSEVHAGDLQEGKE